MPHFERFLLKTSTPSISGETINALKASFVLPVFGSVIENFAMTVNMHEYAAEVAHFFSPLMM